MMKIILVTAFALSAVSMRAQQMYYAYDANGNRGLYADPHNRLFQHEYGHYLQSQSMGPAFIPRVAIPSLMSTMYDDKSHAFQPFEQDANRRAFLYFNKNVDGFYQTEEEYLYNFRHGIQKGWDFFNNPLDVTHGGIQGAYIDYHDPNLPQLLNNLSLQSMQYDYLGWIDGNFWIAGVGNGIYYNKKRVRGAQ